MIGTWHSWEASHHTTHMWLTLVDLAGNLSNTLQMIQYFMTVLIFIVSGIEHGHQQDLYVNGKQRHNCWLNSQLLLQIDDCEWIQCVDPPLPEGMNLKNDFDGTPYEFGENATYTCASPNFYFEEDKNMESFTVECLIGGRWKYPSPSPKCAKSKKIVQVWNKLSVHLLKTHLPDVNCTEPPPAPDGGARVWSGKIKDGSEAR